MIAWYIVAGLYVLGIVPTATLFAMTEELQFVPDIRWQLWLGAMVWPLAAIVLAANRVAPPRGEP